VILAQSANLGCQAVSISNDKIQTFAGTTGSACSAANIRGTISWTFVDKDLAYNDDLRGERVNRPVHWCIALACASACGAPHPLAKDTPRNRRPEVADHAAAKPTQAAPNLARRKERAIALSLGTFHSCALSNDGNVRCWGAYRTGALGNEATRDIGASESPSSSKYVGIGSSATQIAGAYAHACAVTQGGGLACWGRWRPFARGEPQVDVLQLSAPVVQVATGEWHTCALSAVGTLTCFGRGERGALGYGSAETLGDDEPLRSIGDVPVGGKVLQVVAGNNITCALLDSHRVRCWGDALGYPGKKTFLQTPFANGDLALGGDAKEIAAGDSHVCALLTDETVRCWGGGAQGVLGTGREFDIGDDETPAVAGRVDVGEEVVHLAAGQTHNCALLPHGRVRCWGAGEYGRLGYGNTNNVGDDETPASAGDVDVGGEVTQLAAGGFHTCALLSDGCVRCWGLSDHGQLGYGNRTSIGDDEVPATAGCVSIF
jgi:alpha-tubulin suppressor-like RCC1 family protein